MKHAFLTLVLVAVVGCGGGGGALNNDPPPLSWTGDYSGTWKALAVGHNGDAVVSIQANGHISGQVYDRQDDETGTLSGTLRGDGAFQGHVTFSSGTSSLDGSFWQTSVGLDGEVTQTRGGTQFQVEFTLTRDP